MLRSFVIPAVLMLPLTACYVEHDREVPVRAREEVVYDASAPMPAERVEVIPERPRVEAVWHKGHWDRRDGHWVWISGYWS